MGSRQLALKSPGPTTILTVTCWKTGYLSAEADPERRRHLLSVATLYSAGLQATNMFAVRALYPLPRMLAAGAHFGTPTV